MGFKNKYLDIRQEPKDISEWLKKSYYTSYPTWLHSSEKRKSRVISQMQHIYLLYKKANKHKL